jgi:hypothetical protein
MIPSEKWRIVPGMAFVPMISGIAERAAGVGALDDPQIGTDGGG